MKKFIIALIATCIMVLSITGCGNQQIIDTNYTFKKAIVWLPNGEIVEGEVKSWRDYDGSDQIQVNIDDKVYLTHSTNIVLISE